MIINLYTIWLWCVVLLSMYIRMPVTVIKSFAPFIRGQTSNYHTNSSHLVHWAEMQRLINVRFPMLISYLIGNQFIQYWFASSYSNSRGAMDVNETSSYYISAQTFSISDIIVIVAYFILNVFVGMWVSPWCYFNCGSAGNCLLISPVWFCPLRAVLLTSWVISDLFHSWLKPNHPEIRWASYQKVTWMNNPPSQETFSKPTKCMIYNFNI